MGLVIPVPEARNRDLCGMERLLVANNHKVISRIINWRTRLVSAQFHN